MKNLLKLGAIVALLLFGVGQYVNWTNRDMKELTDARRAALTQIQPVLLRYKADTGRFPETLAALTPAYLKEIPAQLHSDGSAEGAKRIRYEATGETATFTYHVIRGPDSTEVFDVAANRFSQNR